MMTARHWDIFCSVIDNFGDIGVCWRLARQLQTEYPIQVRLWVDDLPSFQRICSEVQPTKVQQRLTNGVEVIAWSASMTAASLQAELNNQSADVVIEAFGCELPAAYVADMTQRGRQPLWVNLEYLSAESWVESCHALPSPHPQLALQKYFFFPGFSPKTGGLLRESGLRQQINQFQQSPVQPTALLNALGITETAEDTLKLCLFAYSHPRLSDWLDALAQMDHQVLCLVPAGVFATELLQRYPELGATGSMQRGQLRLQLLPFMDQAEFDQLLWWCDINFVRGEDSLIRAIWAGAPFVWQLYRQQEQAHMEKLNAFWQQYQSDMPGSLPQVLHAFWLAWNQDADLVQPWLQLLTELASWRQHARQWQEQQSQQSDLAKNLVRFVEKKFILPANFTQ
ncbi:MAG: elongation factor P maturation arginine rhamnosyltransferase EarP [Alkalimonas sp.]|nr:elongation factor P maturation arginine rhamnosyltransferase EarP [Alkalimonas sp.]